MDRINTTRELFYRRCGGTSHISTLFQSISSSPYDDQEYEVLDNLIAVASALSVYDLILIMISCELLYFITQTKINCLNYNSKF